MNIIIEDINLVDDPSPTGGKTWEGETLAQFLNEMPEGAVSLADINKALAECGMETITDDQIIVVGVEGE